MPAIPLTLQVYPLIAGSLPPKAARNQRSGASTG